MSVLLEDLFEVVDVDPTDKKDDHDKKTTTKKFDKVSRLVCTTQNIHDDSNLKMTLDINSDIYPIDKGDRITVAFAKTLTEGSESNVYFDPLLGTYDKQSKLMDAYEYVMFGRLFKYKEENTKLSIYVSFGGLLMKLTGRKDSLSSFTPDMNVYILIRQPETRKK
jgi:DNA-directed RNA polymerase I, II, and III subunit RPABC3